MKNLHISVTTNAFGKISKIKLVDAPTIAEAMERAETQLNNFNIKSNALKQALAGAEIHVAVLIKYAAKEINSARFYCKSNIISKLHKDIIDTANQLEADILDISKELNINIPEIAMNNIQDNYVKLFKELAEKLTQRA